MKLLIDMNLSPRWVELLGKAGHVALHWSAVGRPNATDDEIMAFARADGWVVVTHDLDFGAILAATGGDSPSVVQIRADDVSPEAAGQAVIAALVRMEEELRQGALVSVDPGRSRIRLLPLTR